MFRKCTVGLASTVFAVVAARAVIALFRTIRDTVTAIGILCTSNAVACVVSIAIGGVGRAIVAFFSSIGIDIFNHAITTDSRALAFGRAATVLAVVITVTKVAFLSTIDDTITTVGCLHTT